MARKTAEEGGLDAAAEAAERSVTQAAQAAQQHGQHIQALQRQQGTAQVLSTGAIPEVKLAPVGAPTVGDDGRVDHQYIRDPNGNARVVADATKRLPYRRAGAEAQATSEGPTEPEPPPREERFFAVVEGRSVLDKTNGHRTPLRAGKVISDKHYDVANLIRQGVRLKKVSNPGIGADEALIASLME